MPSVLVVAMVRDAALGVAVVFLADMVLLVFVGLVKDADDDTLPAVLFALLPPPSIIATNESKCDWRPTTREEGNNEVVVVAAAVAGWAGAIDGPAFGASGILRLRKALSKENSWSQCWSLEFASGLSIPRKSVKSV